MKNFLLFVSMAALLGTIGAAAQEKSSDGTVEPVSFPAQQTAYSSNDIQVLGTLGNGQTSKLVEYSRTPQYRAYVFEGNGRDQVEVTAIGADRHAFIALADQSLNPIASGTGRVSVTLPYHGPDAEAFYILFKASAGQPTRLAVHLKQTAAPTPAPDATH
jgi:hypothetical protein